MGQVVNLIICKKSVNALFHRASDKLLIQALPYKKFVLK